jgi:hypothetical protein
MTLKKNKWNMEAPLPSTSRMVTRSRAQELPREIVSAINTSIPCFCGNQRLLQIPSTNCKQQMYNWVSTGDPYTYTEDDWAHESEPIAPAYDNANDEDFGLPNLFDEQDIEDLLILIQRNNQRSQPGKMRKNTYPTWRNLEILLWMKHLHQAHPCINRHQNLQGQDQN